MPQRISGRHKYCQEWEANPLSIHSKDLTDGAAHHAQAAHLLHCPRIRFTEADRDAARAKIHEYRGWYKLARWCAKPHGLRWRVLVRDQFTCQMCQRLEHNTSLLVADHKIPHKGDITLFWADGNVWTAVMMTT